MLQIIIEIPHIKQSVILKGEVTDESWAGHETFKDLVKAISRINFDTHAPNEYIAKSRFSFKGYTFRTWRPEGDSPFLVNDKDIVPADHNFVWRRDGRHWCYGNGSVSGAWPFTAAFLENPDEYSGIDVMRDLDNIYDY